MIPKTILTSVGKAVGDVVGLTLGEAVGLFVGFYIIAIATVRSKKNVVR